MLEDERIRRTAGLYRGRSIPPPVLPDNQILFDLRHLFNSYSQKWNVDISIMYVNLIRLFRIISKFVSSEVTLSLKECFLLLEFYLQMDGKSIEISSIMIILNEDFSVIQVECFYMKTHQQPHDIGLFAKQMPVACFTMKQCTNEHCRVCYERIDLTHRFGRAINFSKNQIHRCINGYQIYLNANAVSRNQF